MCSSIVTARIASPIPPPWAIILVIFHSPGLLSGTHKMRQESPKFAPDLSRIAILYLLTTRGTIDE
jgi:hypothetical protein